MLEALENPTKFLLQGASELLLQDHSSEVRQAVLDKKLLDFPMGQLKSLSKFDGRSDLPVADKKDEDVSALKVDTTVSVTSKPSDSTSTKKKGVGYGSDSTGANSKWDPSAYIKAKESKSAALQVCLLGRCFRFTYRLL
jgi:hypothetical protein